MQKQWTVEIPIKTVSANEYINACRTNVHKANKMKHDIQAAIGVCISHLPRMTKPVWIDFIWSEKNGRRDRDNVAFGKKFVLDALVNSGKLLDDSRKYVTGFSDSFRYGEDYKITLIIREDEDDTEGTAHSRNAKARRSHSKDKV